MRKPWLSRPALLDLESLLDPIFLENPQGARNLRDAFQDHLGWIAATPNWNPSVWMRYRGYAIHKATFSRTRRYRRYHFFFLLREADVPVIAFHYAAADPDAVRGHVAGGVLRSEPEL